MYVTPAVAGDAGSGEVVLAGSCNGVYFAFDAENGTVLWRYDTSQDGGPPRNFHGDPLVIGDTVVTPADAIDDRGGVYAFAIADGTLRWHAAVGNVDTDLLRHRDLAIGGTTDGGLVAVGLGPGSAARGAVAWRFDLVGEPGQVRTMTPALDGGTIFHGGRDGRVYAIDAATGAVAWQQDHACHASTRTVVDDGRIWLGCGDGRLLRLARNDGRLEQALDLGGRPHHGLTRVAGGLIVLVGSDTLAYVDEDLEAVRWTRTTPKEWSTFRPLVLSDHAWAGRASAGRASAGRILVGNGEGELWAFDLATGDPVWTRHLGGIPRGLGRHGTTLYVGSLRGTLTAFEPEALAVSP